MAAMALALVWAAGAQSAGGTQVTQQALTMSDGAKLACSTTTPGGVPVTPRPGVILFHGLGGKHEDMEPLATGVLAPAGYASLMCDARGHGTWKSTSRKTSTSVRPKNGVGRSIN